MEDVLASIPEAVVIVHDSHVLYTNPAFTRMFGYSAEEASGAILPELIVPDTRRHEQEMLELALDQHGRATIETVRMNKNGDAAGRGFAGGAADGGWSEDRLCAYLPRHRGAQAD